MVTISSSLDVVMTSIGSLKKLNEKLELVQKARLGPGYDSEATVLNRCVLQRLWTDVGSLPATRRVGSRRAWESSRRVHRRAQAAPSRVHHLTTKNWCLTGRKPVTACQQDLTLHSPVRNAAFAVGKGNPC